MTLAPLKARIVAAVLALAVAGLGKPGLADMLAYRWPDIAAVFAPANRTSFTIEGCNAVSFGSTPGLGSQMIGRSPNGSPSPTKCPLQEQGWSLSMMEMDWPNRHMRYLYPLLDTSARPVAADGGAHVITSAYDPTVVPYRDDYWVAFECAGPEMPSAASCVGPLVKDPSGRLAIDTSRISIIAMDPFPDGDDPHDGAPGINYYHAAGVPKLVTHRERLYLYWDVGTAQTPLALGYPANFLGSGYRGEDFRKTVKRIDVRGAELAIDPASNRLYVVGHRSAISSIDPVASTEVVANADAFQVIDYAGILLMTGGLAPGDGRVPACGSPLGSFPWTRTPIPDCYREFFAQSSEPLGRFQLASEDGIPVNANEYNRFVYRPSDGRTVLMGGLTHGLSYGSNNDAASYIYPWPDNLLKPDHVPAIPVAAALPRSPVVKPLPSLTALPATADQLTRHLYECALSREPKPDELVSWRATLAAGVALRQLFVSAFTSPEYEASAVSDARFVLQLYRCILFRDPDRDGFRSSIALLARGRTRADIVAASAQSVEFASRIAPKLVQIPGIHLRTGG